MEQLQKYMSDYTILYLGAYKTNGFVQADDDSFRYIAASLKHILAVKRNKQSINDPGFMQLQLDYRNLEPIVSQIVKPDQ